ncbi:hypothetical protein E2C01_026441 [Portunus trituberculatus]|uniref:Uncharacterized protein n=1 Tax=Portunus trituberculatus TaxID=210409 RepID=A0A5B7EIV6_PORTR|nr:hypothetical protein [Portunus trituberculatus]
MVKKNSDEDDYENETINDQQPFTTQHLHSPTPSPPQQPSGVPQRCQDEKWQSDEGPLPKILYSFVTFTSSVT